MDVDRLVRKETRYVNGKRETNYVVDKRWYELPLDARKKASLKTKIWAVRAQLSEYPDLLQAVQAAGLELTDLAGVRVYGEFRDGCIIVARIVGPANRGKFGAK